MREIKVRNLREIQERLETYKKNLELKVGHDAKHIIRRAAIELDWVLGGSGK